jgi:ATPase family associated with various cellular activities (AAA)
MSKSQTISTDLTALLRARVPVLWVVTREEARVEFYVAQACANAGHVPYTWDCGAGVLDTDGTPIMADMTDIENLMQEIASRSRGGTTRNAWILRDAHTWLSGPIGIKALRLLCNIARSRASMQRDSAQAIVILTPSGEVPPELAGHVTVLEWPGPDREEVAKILDDILQDVPEDVRATSGNGVREAAIDAAIGLSGPEASACFSKSLVQTRSLAPASIMQEKKRIISREGVLEWYDPLPGGLDSVGGLDLLKSWLVSRASAYTLKAREYGLPAPRGALLVGVPGCGKSLTAKAIATAWGVPLIRLDLNALKSKFVGGSEANLRRALRVIEAIGRCVVWIDEVEKALQGATSGSSDGGVSTDALGTVLSWMQERTGDAFVIATANDVESLPPELMRAGRFDDVWFIDLPGQGERMAVLQASLRNFKRTVSANDLLVTARASDGFSGAEVAALVPNAMFAAFADGERQITIDDLLAAAKAVVPASQTNAKKLKALREWANGKARLASTPETSVAPSKRSALDL